MSRQQSGFTLIELIIVIVILGALAVVALPRFVDLQDDADQAALEGVAGSLSSAFATNYAASLTREDTSTFGGDPGTDAYVEVGEDDPGSNENQYEDSLQTGTPLTDNDISISSEGCAFGANGSAGDTTTCEIVSDDGNTAEFTAIRTE